MAALPGNTTGSAVSTKKPEVFRLGDIAVMVDAGAVRKAPAADTLGDGVTVGGAGSIDSPSALHTKDNTCANDAHSSGSVVWRLAACSHCAMTW